MAYQLTPEQRAGINDVDGVCREHGLPGYHDLVRATARLCVEIREGRPTGIALKRACDLLEGLRNDSADPRPLTIPRS